MLKYKGLRPKALVALPEYSTSASSVTKTRYFFEDLGFQTNMMVYRNINKKDIENAALIGIARPDYISNYDVNQFGKFCSLILGENAPIVALGDANARLLESISIKSTIVSNHSFSADRVHSILDDRGVVYYIPSRHAYAPTIDLESFCVDSVGAPAFLKVLAVSPERDANKPKVLENEIEIYSIPTLGLLGILGSPEEFYRHDKPDHLDNDIAYKTLKFIKNKLTELLAI